MILQKSRPWGPGSGALEGQGGQAEAVSGEETRSPPAHRSRLPEAWDREDWQEGDGWAGPLLTLFRGHADFPTHAPTALEVAHALTVCLTVVGGVEHQALASDHGTPARLHPIW